jgi:uncharacterized protein YegL
MNADLIHDTISSSAATPDVAISLVCDVSGSMSGTKCIAMKLGICAIISSLKNTDLVSIISFNTVVTHRTQNFIDVGTLKARLPEILASALPEACTAMYDATMRGLAVLEQLYSDSNATSTTTGRKHVLMTLTDGEDNSSSTDIRGVFDRLAEPKLSDFLFILLAVDMRNTRQFRQICSLRHCKQIDIGVSSGGTMLRVIHEVLFNRIFGQTVTRVEVDEYGEEHVLEDRVYANVYSITEGAVYRDRADSDPVERYHSDDEGMARNRADSWGSHDGMDLDNPFLLPVTTTPVPTPLLAYVLDRHSSDDNEIVLGTSPSSTFSFVD